MSHGSTIFHNSYGRLTHPRCWPIFLDHIWNILSGACSKVQRSPVSLVRLSFTLLFSALSMRTIGKSLEKFFPGGCIAHPIYRWYLHRQLKPENTTPNSHKIIRNTCRRLQVRGFLCCYCNCSNLYYRVSASLREVFSSRDFWMNFFDLRLKMLAFFERMHQNSCSKIEIDAVIDLQELHGVPNYWGGGYVLI